ncbi:MAG: acyclic terpene utilization AtuA family protein [Symbiobacteriia bacterium]
MKSIRIGAGQGFYGDSLLPALDVARYGKVQYISSDTLAELTLAILQKGRKKDPDGGYTKDVVPTMRALLPLAREKGIKLVTNAGGVNPWGAVKAVAQVARELGLMGLKIGVVTGDNIMPRLDELIAAGADLRDKDTHAELSTVRDRLLFANVYLGGAPIAEALAKGADVVITGRTTDTGQFLGPVQYEFGWGPDDVDQLASGILLGHLMECSGQVSGGNFSGDWWNVPNLERIGFPVSEVFEDGTFILQKSEGTGGRVSVETVKQQLLYEIHDPSTYLTPDVIADFSQVKLEQVGPDQVRVSGARGRKRPPTLKALMGYSDGWMGEGYVTFGWPDAYAKAERAESIIRRRLEMWGVRPEEVLAEYIGINQLHGGLSPLPVADINEVRLRLAVRTKTRDEAEKVAREFPPLLLSGPPTASAIGGTPAPRELLGLWSCLIPRELIEPQQRVEIEEVR